MAVMLPVHLFVGFTSMDLLNTFTTCTQITPEGLQDGPEVPRWPMYCELNAIEPYRLFIHVLQVNSIHMQKISGLYSNHSQPVVIFVFDILNIIH
jgi:hypothetical protein